MNIMTLSIITAMTSSEPPPVNTPGELDKWFEKATNLEFGDIKTLKQIFVNLQKAVSTDSHEAAKDCRKRLGNIFDTVKKYKTKFLNFTNITKDSDNKFKKSIKQYQTYFIKYNDYIRKRRSVTIDKPINKKAVWIGVGVAGIATTLYFLDNYLEMRGIKKAIKYLEAEYGKKPFTFKQANDLLTSKRMKNVAELFNKLRGNGWIVDTKKGIMIPSVEYYIKQILKAVKGKFKKGTYVSDQDIFKSLKSIKLNKKIKKELIHYMKDEGYIEELSEGSYIINARVVGFY